MSTVKLQASLEGKGSYVGKSYFFLGNQYTRYDSANGRVEDGYPLNIDQWDLKNDFSVSIDAAINGEGKFEGKAYFFKNDKYCRYDWKKNKVDPNFPASLSLWKLPKGFIGKIDGAVNGLGRFKDKAYFFKGNQYVRYDWLKKDIDSGYPQKLDAWNLPNNFLSGIDAVLNGHGSNQDKAFFIKGSECAIYDWIKEDFESVVKIENEWPLLRPLTNLGPAKNKVNEWLVDTFIKLDSLILSLRSGTAYKYNMKLMDLALETHFIIPKSMMISDKLKNILVIKDNFEKVKKSLDNSRNSFRGRILNEVLSDGMIDPSSKRPFPAYTRFNHDMNFTETFADFGPLCQAAMLLHENVHYVDNKATATNDIYEHIPRYAKMTLSEALHNPSSYVCFAQHLFYGKDERFGASKPNL